MAFPQALEPSGLLQRMGKGPHCPNSAQEQFLCPQKPGARGQPASRGSSATRGLSQPGATSALQCSLSHSLTQQGCSAPQLNTLTRIPASPLGRSLRRPQPAEFSAPAARTLRTAAAQSGGPGRADECSTLWGLCNAAEASFFELCVRNGGRPAAQALLGFVEAAVEAHACGYSLRAMLLELSLGAPAPTPTPSAPSTTTTTTATTSGGANSNSKDSSASSSSSSGSGSGASRGSSEFRLTSAGYRLTSSEQGYRDQWLQLVFLTLSRLRTLSGAQIAANEQAQAQQAGSSRRDRSGAATENTELSAMRMLETGAEEGGEEEGEGLLDSDAPGWMVSIVDRVIMGQATGEEQSAVRFDRALATGGASGGVAAEKVVIAPQWVPATQLVLLTMKVQAQRQQQR